MGGKQQGAKASSAAIGRRCALLAANALLSLVVAVSHAAAAVTPSVRTVAVTGTSIVPDNDAVRFNSFGTPSLNNRGDVAFLGRLVGDITSQNDAGYWIAGSAGFKSVVREGASVPHFPEGTVFGSFDNLSFPLTFNDAGKIAFTAAAVSGTPSTIPAIWTGDGDQLNLVVKHGDLAPGATDGATFNIFSNIPRLTLNRTGNLAFQAMLSAPYTNPPNGADGVWRVAPDGTLEPAALTRENAAGLGEEAVVVDFRPPGTHVPLNRSGTVALHGVYDLTGGTTTSGTGLWTESGAGPELRAWALTPAPELGPSATVSVRTMGGIDAAGNLVFNGDFANGSVGGGKGQIIGIAGSDGLQIVAHSGGNAPGAGAGHVFGISTFSYEPTINSSGQVAFYGDEFDGVNFGTHRSGVWAGAPGALSMIARQGDPAPGTGANFGTFIRDTPAINRFGQVAFVNGLQLAPAGTSSTLWVTGLDSELVLVARSGDTIEVAPGDERTIQFFSMTTFHGDDDGKPRGLNDRGQVTFGATFVGGTSGIFVSNVAAHLPGDFNGDGTVDAADYTVWRAAVESQDLAADGTRDGTVDAEDYALWKEFFGQSLDLGGGSIAAANAPVPEPAAGVLLLFAATIAALRPRRAGRINRPLSS